MPDHMLNRPDLISIRVAAEHVPVADAADGSRTMTALTTASDRYRMVAVSSTDRAIRRSTVAAVLAVAGIAAYVSYWHAYAVVQAHGANGIAAKLEPATIDGLVYASSMVILYAARHQISAPALARWLLGLGIAATLTANMAQGWAHGPAGAIVAAWPAISLAGSYELLLWLIRTAGTPEHEPSPRHRCEDVACPTVACSAPTANSRSEQPRRSFEDRHAQDRRPTGQRAGQPVTPGSATLGDTAPEVDVSGNAAVAAYMFSVKAGNPLSERKLAQMFGRTSRRWARARIAEAQRSI